jgi:hypothetical protein
MKKAAKLSVLVVVGLFVAIMLATPAVAPRQQAWRTTGNNAPSNSVLGTLNERPLRIITFGTPKMIVTTTGDVGIGIGTPTEKLDVAGNVHASGTFIAGSTTTYGDGFIGLSPGTDLNIDSGTVFVDGDNNRVGIGNTDPETILHIGNGGNPILKIDGAVNTPGEGPRLRWTEAWVTDYGVEAFLDGGTGTDALIFRRIEGDEVTLDNILVLKRTNGRVGIGKVRPTELLDVAGNVHADGTFIAGSTTTYGDGFIGLSVSTDLNIDSGTLYIDNTNDRVGIGTVSPSTTLEVNGVITAYAGTSTHWTTAYGWGDHSTAGYLTSYTEIDPVYSASAASGITSGDITNWDTAYGWGDHSIQGYLTSESDPIFGASAAVGISSGDITNWNAAYGWGDHSIQGYLTSEIDPIFGSSAASGISSGDITNWDTAYGWGDHALGGYLTSESDPIFGASPAGGIIAGDITNWNSAYGWGDHALAGYLTSESDPIFGASPAGGILAGDITNWNAAYGWGDHSIQGYLTSETDPIFGASAAVGISGGDITNWDTAYGWDDHSLAGYDTSNPEAKLDVHGSATIGSSSNSATGNYAIAMGGGTTAIGDYSTAMGSSTTAYEIYSTAMGYGTYASGSSSTAMGRLTTAYGDYSTAMGYDTYAYGRYSTAMGYDTNASGSSSTAMGYKSDAYGRYSTAMGRMTNASEYASTAMGINTDAYGAYSTAMGSGTNASGAASTAMGVSSIAYGGTSTAMGGYTNASGSFSTAMGTHTNASGYASTAMGYYTTASNTASTAMGYETTASGFYSTAMGREIVAKGDYSVAIALSDQNGLLVYQHNTMAIMGGKVGIGTVIPQRDFHVSDTMRLEPRTTAPSSPGEGDIYYDSTLHKLMVYDGTLWQACF